MGDSSQTKDPILVALRVPSERRTKRDLQPIIEFVRGLKFFHSFSQYPHTVEAIASHLNLHTFFSGEIVFSEGDPGDLFYIILDGEVTISKRKKLHSLIDFVTENVVLVKLGVGKYFGETALESQEGLRTATATASKPSNLLSLNRNAYQTILLELKLLLRGAVRRSLSSPSSIFGHINAEIIERLSELVVIRTFGLQEEIFSAGRKVNSLMVVKTGIVKLIKSISRREMDSTIQQEEAKYAPPDPSAFTTLSRPTTPATPLLTPLESPIMSSRSPRAPGSSHPTSKLKSPRSGRLSPIISSPARPTPASSSIFPSKAGAAASPLTSSRPSVPVSASKTTSPVSTPSKPGRTSPKRGTEETPLGYWVLTRSDAYIESSRARRPGEHASPGHPRGSTEDQIDFTVAVLMPGQVCGETALLDPEYPSPISAVAATAVELYCFDSELLFALGIHRDRRIMRSLMDDWKFRNPPQAEILKQLRERYKWEKRKGNILKSMTK